MRETVKTIIIANAASESGVLDKEGRTEVSFRMPSAWTAAAITFLGSDDNSTFGPVWDSSGNELTIASANVVASRVICVVGTLAEALASIRYLKFRSGTAAAPVNQLAERSIAVMLNGWGWFAPFDPAG